MRKIRVVFLLLVILVPGFAFAQAYYPDSSNPAILIGSSVDKCLNSSGQAVPVSSGQCANGPQPKTYVSAGSSQFGLSVTTNTQLTVPSGATCAQITVEGAGIRRTSDGTSASATVGTPIPVGTSWQDCGPLAAYKFTAVSGSPTLDVEYFQ